jgi:multimeric flavodoxin WrbA
MVKPRKSSGREKPLWKTTVLGLAGSPVIKGNTDLLLDAFIRGATDAGALCEKVYVCTLHIAPCDNGGGCWKTGRCTVNDDMVEIYPKLLSADIIAIASPVYFMGLPAQLKAVIDRCQSVWVKRFILKNETNKKKRKGFFISAGGGNYKDLFAGSKATVKSLFATIGARYCGDLLYPDAGGSGSIRNRPAALKEARDAGKALAESR